MRDDRKMADVAPRLHRALVEAQEIERERDERRERLRQSIEAFTTCMAKVTAAMRKLGKACQRC
jgi:hypothetical protein